MSIKKILMVEDDEFLGRLLKEKFEQEKYSITLATTGQAGLNCLLQSPLPDLVLLDLILPGVDGFEVLNQIRHHQDPNIVRLPVVILSNLGSPSDIDRVKKLGANDYLVKAQLTPAEIVEKINRFTV